METQNLPSCLWGGISWANLKENNEDIAIKKHFSAKCHYCLKLHNHFSSSGGSHSSHRQCRLPMTCVQQRGPLLSTSYMGAWVLPASMGTINNLEGDLAWGTIVWKIYSCRLGWNLLSPEFPKIYTHTHGKENWENEREKKATLGAKHINLASQNPGRQELKAPFAQRLSQAKHMDSAPPAQSCYT